MDNFTAQPSEGVTMRNDLLAVQKLSRTAGISPEDITRFLKLPDDNNHTGRVVFAGQDFQYLVGRKVHFFNAMAEITIKGRPCSILEAKNVLAVLEEDEIVQAQLSSKA